MAAGHGPADETRPLDEVEAGVLAHAPRAQRHEELVVEPVPLPGSPPCQRTAGSSSRVVISMLVDSWVMRGATRFRGVARPQMVAKGRADRTETRLGRGGRFAIVALMTRTGAIRQRRTGSANASAGVSDLRHGLTQGAVGPPRVGRGPPRRPAGLFAPETVLLWASLAAVLAAAAIGVLCALNVAPAQRALFFVMLGTPVLAASGVVYAVVAAIRMMLRTA